MLIPAIRWRQCLPKAHRTRPPRTPDARSCKVSEREKVGAFPLRLSKGKVHGIAHRVKPGWWVAGRCGKHWGSRKNSHGPLPRFHPTAVPDVPREAWCAPPRLTYETLCCPW